MKSLTIWILLAACCMSSAFAQSGNALGLLQRGNYEAVERAFATLQSKFAAGKATEYELLDAYKIFYQKEDNYRTFLNNWISAYPNSASAYLARGVYFRKLGEFRRGENYISQVPREHLKYMEQMFVLAEKDLATSLRLNPKSYLAVLHLLNMAQFVGNDRAAKKYLDLGQEVLPANFILRARYLIHLAPRWGGSYQDMEKFIEECRAQGLPTNRTNLLRAIMYNDVGFSAEEQGNIDAARTAYENALTLAQSGGPRFRQDYMSYAERICQEPRYSNKPYCHL